MQAYLQTASLLRRAVYLRPHGIQLGKDELLQLMLPLYALTEAGDYWGETLTNHCLEDVGFEQSAADLLLCFKRQGEKLQWLSANYVDDHLRAAPPSVRASMEQSLRERFECKPASELPTAFLGVKIRTLRTGFVADMMSYISRLALLRDDAIFKDFSSMRAMLLWVAHVCRDMSAFVSFICSVTAETYIARDHVKLVNENLLNLQATSTLGLEFPKLDYASLNWFLMWTVVLRTARTSPRR
jgi:hypothetical protein